MFLQIICSLHKQMLKYAVTHTTMGIPTEMCMLIMTSLHETVLMLLMFISLAVDSTSQFIFKVL